MGDQYTVELIFNRPPEDIRRMSEVIRRSANMHAEQDHDDIIYGADVMEEIADKMEVQDARL